MLNTASKNNSSEVFQNWGENRMSSFRGLAATLAQAWAPAATLIHQSVRGRLLRQAVLQWERVIYAVILH